MDRRPLPSFLRRQESRGRTTEESGTLATVSALDSCLRWNDEAEPRNSYLKNPGIRLKDPLRFARRNYPAAIQSTTRSPIIITVGCIPPPRRSCGTTEASATHRFCIPLTRQCWSTTVIESESGPMRQVPDT